MEYIAVAVTLHFERQNEWTDSAPAIQKYLETGWQILGINLVEGTAIQNMSSFVVTAIYHLQRPSKGNNELVLAVDNALSYTTTLEGGIGHGH